MAVLTFAGPALAEVAKIALTGKKVYLVHDDGVYLCVHADGAKQGTVCYAKGYNPAVDGHAVFERARVAVGGDDFGEDLGLSRDFLTAMLEADATVKVTASQSRFSISLIRPLAPDDRRKDLEDQFRKAGLVILEWKGDNHVRVRNDARQSIYDMKKGRGRKWSAVSGTSTKLQSVTGVA